MISANWLIIWLKLSFWNNIMACKQQELDAARLAYHNLMTGKMARVIVDQNGERVEFVAANVARLQAYIQTLEAECSAATTGRPRVRGPFGFLF